MPFLYEWKTTRGGRRYVRTFVPDAPVKAAKEVAPVEPVEETVTQVAIGRLPTVDEQFDAAEAVVEAPKPKRGRPRKVTTDE